MQELLEETPDSLATFRQWVRRAADHIEPLIDRDTRGAFDHELHGLIAELIRRAKLHAFRLGLFGLANQLPEREEKTCIDALLRLRECAEWHEPAPAPVNGQPLTVLQAADALGISERTARDLIASGELTHHRVGNGRGRVRILPSDLEAYRGRTEAGFSHLFR